MNPTITIRPIIIDELKHIFKLEEDMFKPKHYPLFSLRQLYDLFPNLFLVAVDDTNQIKGYCIGGLNPMTKVGWILALAVIESAQNNKIGQQLTSALIQELQKESALQIQLTTTPDNSAAINIYEKLGFKTFLEDDNYYLDNSPRIVMKLETN